jgi:short-subunit dehydrogenase
MVYGCHSFIPRMRAQGSGYILNVASAAGLLSMMEMAPYNTSKAAVISLSETLKAELAPHRIGVTVLCPMFFKTNLLDSMTYTDEFEKNLAHVGFDHARMTAGQVAEAAIRAVEKGKLYCVTQLSGRMHWIQKRISPSLYFAQMALLNRLGWARPLFLWMGRHGLM